MIIHCIHDELAHWVSGLMQSGHCSAPNGDRAAGRRAVSRCSSRARAASAGRRAGAAASRVAAAPAVVAACGGEHAETEQQGEDLDAPRGSSHVMDLLVCAWGDGARLPLQRRSASEHVIRPAGTARSGTSRTGVRPLGLQRTRPTSPFPGRMADLDHSKGPIAQRGGPRYGFLTTATDTVDWTVRPAEGDTARSRRTRPGRGSHLRQVPRRRQVEP